MINGELLIRVSGQQKRLVTSRVVVMSVIEERGVLGKSLRFVFILNCWAILWLDGSTYRNSHDKPTHQMMADTGSPLSPNPYSL